MQRILYLHGFASCGQSNKSSALRGYFGEDQVFSPDLPYAPADAVSYIDDLMRKEEIDMVIGSSLGGFYATYFAEKYALKAVLLNPSVTPWETLAPHVGWQKRFCDGKAFEFKAVYLNQLEALQAEPVKGAYLVLLQSGDETLDYEVAKHYYREQKVVVEYGGNHRFENIDCYFSMIERFGSFNECR